MKDIGVNVFETTVYCIMFAEGDDREQQTIAYLTSDVATDYSATGL